ncbi:hypothetical protein FHR32_001605 [Streptosporangium album]|uniref:Dioxygenase n=1 Tax=Streptosporangium album TaxID=47479 RepID=A0A7W7RSG8_9ACTN|nr:carotenoid oxygenase family protein [Streptosporangium album]MBB4937300.1 hypothetical protein [Streptosporangium album]
MTTAQNADMPLLHLAGNNAPVTEEMTLEPAEVIGAVPEELNGVYLRNGPNPRTGWSPHYFAGDGMVHAVALDGGRARWYRNRYVRTPLYEHPGESRFALAFDGALHTPMTAHPKICPGTGELLFFGSRLRPPYLTYYRAAPTGELTRRTESTGCADETAGSRLGCASVVFRTPKPEASCYVASPVQSLIPSGEGNRSAGQDRRSIAAHDFSQSAGRCGSVVPARRLGQPYTALRVPDAPCQMCPHVQRRGGQGGVSGLHGPAVGAVVPGERAGHLPLTPQPIVPFGA